MDFTGILKAGQDKTTPDTWGFILGTADGDHHRDQRAWDKWDLVPRVMTGLTEIDTSVVIDGHRFNSPLVLAPSASQGALNPEGEVATRRAGAKAGVLVGYSFHATTPVETFAAASTDPWWAQAYAMKDRGISDAYIHRCVENGASTIVLTVDVPGTLADAPFRKIPLSAPLAVRGNYPADGSTPVTESYLTPDEIARTAEIAGVPVWAKGMMTPEDALRALDAGAAGVFVSNHGRRQVAGVAPTAAVLREIVEAVDDSAPVVVDGGIRSGTDVVRALALGATAVGIGRPIPWALAAGGQDALDEVVSTFNEEIRVAMASLGAGKVADLVPSMVRPAWR